MTFPGASSVLAFKSGTVTSGHCVQWSGTAGGLSDSGSACGTGSGGVTSFNTRTGAVTLNSSDVTSALTYTPLSTTGNGSALTITTPSATTGVAASTLIGDYRDVRSFGALCNGTGDDTSAIQAALTQTASDGIPLFIPNGSCEISSQISSSGTNIHVIGQSWAAQFVRKTTFNGALLDLTGASANVSDMTFNGQGATVANTNSAELILSGANSIANHIQILNSIYIGINVSGNYDTLINSTITGLATSPSVQQGYGVWAISGATGIAIVGNTISGTGIDAVGINGTGCSVSRNHIFNDHSYTAEGGGQVATYPTTTDCIIEGNVIQTGNAGVSSGLELNGDGNGVSVLGNVVSNQKWFGIVEDPASANSQVLIADNTVENNQQVNTVANAAAITFPANASNFSVLNNHLIDNQSTPTQQYGVNIPSGTSNNYQIEGNYCSGNVVACITDSGSGVSKIIKNNFGIDNVIPSVASASALPIPLNPTFDLTGTTGVTSLTGDAWTGREITVIPSGVVTFTAGSNIANSYTSTANYPFKLFYNGTAWNVMGGD